MRIRHVRIFVTDLAAAKNFYAQTLGLNILWEYEFAHFEDPAPAHS
jgi:catechol 2,3-dioxygenase-like lactoylglutathione lyase family enzyme